MVERKVARSDRVAIKVGEAVGVGGARSERVAIEIQEAVGVAMA
jgi:hypothetical protein